MSGSLPNSLLLKYKGNYDVFFETGTSEGDTVLTALECGFSRIYSVELDEIVHNRALQRFSANLDTVTLFHSTSVLALNTTLPFINDPILFWLDAHKDSDIECTPLIQELEAIKGHKYPTRILIDDMRLVGVNKWDITIALITEKLMDINPHFDIIFEDNGRAPGDVLVAYDPREE